MDKKMKTAKEQQEDAALNRALLWVAGAVILEGLLLLVNRYFVNFYNDEIDITLAISAMIRVGCFLFPVLAAAGAFWYYKTKKAEKPALLQGALALAMLMLFLFCLVIQVFYMSGVTLLFVLVPAAAVLALVYYLYQRECFCAIGLTALGLFGMWLVRKGSAGPYLNLIRAYLIILAVVSLALLVFTVLLRQKKGVVTFRGKELRLLSKKANYPLLLLTCAIMLAAFVAALVLSPSLTYYLIFALIVWAFILVAYYTVQLL